MQLKLTPALAAELRARAPASTTALQALEDKRRASHRTLTALTDEQAEHRLEVARGQQSMAGVDPRFQAAYVDREKARIAPHEAEIARLQPVIEKAQERHRVYASVVPACLAFIYEHREGHYRDVPLPHMARPPGGWPEAVEAQRQALANRHERRAAVAKARPACAEVVAKVKAHFAALREKGRPDVAYLLRPGGSVDDIRWPVTSTEWKQPGTGAIQRAVVPDVEAILAWLPGAGDKLAAAVVAEIEAAAKGLDGEALTDAERERLLADLAAEMLQIERVEEALIREVEGEGLEILRRADADPRAVLSVEVVDAASAPEGRTRMAPTLNALVAVAGGE